MTSTDQERVAYIRRTSRKLGYSSSREDIPFLLQRLRTVEAERDAALVIIRRQERIIEGYESFTGDQELGLLRSVVGSVRALHQPDADGVCASCATALGGGWDVVPMESPCPTLDALPPLASLSVPVVEDSGDSA